MACKVNLHKYWPLQGRYLSYIKRNMEVISRYFVDWIGATGMEAGSVYTANLISVVDGLPEEELPVEDGKPLPRAEVKKRVYEYVKATTGRLVNVQQLSEDIFEPKVLEEVKPTSGGILNLDRLSQVLYGREKGSALVDAAERQGIEIDTEFQVDAKELRKLVRIEVEADDVLLRFSPRDKERKVRLDGDRVIIDSKEFARKYRQELGIDGAS